MESASGNSITAIEGNTSPDSGSNQSNGGMVCWKARKLSLDMAFIRSAECEKEDDMLDIDKLTDTQILQLANRIQAVLGVQQMASTLSGELQEAAACGITSGASPYATRAQAAVMALRTAKQL